MSNKYGLHLNDWIEVAVRKRKHNEFHCRMIDYNNPLFRSVAGSWRGKGRARKEAALHVRACLTVWRFQPGPPENFQPIRNRSFNKGLSVRTSSGTVLFSTGYFRSLTISPFRIAYRRHLPVCFVWLLFVKYTSIYCSVRGMKVPCICGEKISLVTRLCLKTSHCSCFLYRWIAFSYSCS